MAIPLSVWEVNDAFNRAIAFEEEQDEQIYEEEPTPEDEFIVRLSPCLKKNIGSEDSLANVSKLIITTDNISAGFTDTYLLGDPGDKEKAGLISGPYSHSKDGNTVYQNSFWDKTCFLYCLGVQDDVILCQMKQNMDQKCIFYWVEKVFKAIRPRHVITLTSVPQCKLQIENPEKEGFDFICQLKTDALDLKTNCSDFPKPNLIRDIPAAVLTHCQVHSIPAISYVLVTETQTFDVNAVKSFAPVLKEDIFLDMQKVPESKIKDGLKKLCSMRIPDNGVFI